MTGKNTQEAEIDKERAEFLEERKLLIQGSLSAFQTFEKYLILLSTGALVITFQAFGSKSAAQAGFLYVQLGWGALALSLVTALISFLLSTFAWSNQIRIAYEIYECGSERAAKIRNPYNDWVQVMNVCATCLFVVGLFCLSVFAMT